MDGRRLTSGLIPLIAAVGFLLIGTVTMQAQRLALAPLGSEGTDGFRILFFSASTPITGLQFDIQYGPEAVDLFPSTGDAVRGSNKQLALRKIQPGRMRVVVSGLDQAGLQSGAIVDVLTGALASTGSSEIRLSDVKSVHGDGIAGPLNPPEGPQALRLATMKRLSPEGVWNAASLKRSSVSGGSLLTLKGVRIGPPVGVVPEGGGPVTTLSGTSVTFQGVPGTLLYAGPDQINVIAPWGVAELRETQIEVLHDGVRIASVTVPVEPSTPALFTLTSTGTGGAAALNEDGSVNTPGNRAIAGSFISLYGTGLGPVSPAGVDGSISGPAEARFAVTVTIGGIAAEVQYAGAAPGLISGVVQINCRIPSEVMEGIAVPVVVRAGTRDSPLGVSIAVKSKDSADVKEQKERPVQ